MEEVVVNLVSALTGALTIVLIAYIKSQKFKDETIQKERDRSDRLVKEERESATTEKDKIILHYEQMLEFVKNSTVPDCPNSKNCRLHSKEIKEVIEKHDTEKFRMDETKKFSLSDIVVIRKEIESKLGFKKEREKNGN